MYSVLLMMAMTSGGDLPNLGHHGCCGGGYVSSCCGGYYGGYSSCCCGGYASSCCGGYVGGYSCCGGGYVSSCCGGGYSSCCGGGYSSCCGGGGHRLFGRRHSCCGGGYSSCCGYVSSCCGGGYVGGYTCCGGYVGGYVGGEQGVIVEEKKDGDKGKEEKINTKPAPDKEESLAPAPATIIVSLPADAKLTIDDAATVSTTATRVFTSPTLPVGRDFHYTLKAEYARDGRPVVLSKEITVRAGADTRVNMEEASGVASR